MQSEKTKKLDLIDVLNTRKMNLIAQIQSNESEPRITSIARDELGMVKNEDRTIQLRIRN